MRGRHHEHELISTALPRLRLLRRGCPQLTRTTGDRGNRPETTMTPDQALAALKEGNDKFITDSPLRSVQGRERRLEIARGQAPFAVLVSCSDSRVPPELLFGRGLGELFIVRNAGNTVDTAALGSIQYAVAELGVPLVLVLGHERCGAVDAAVQVVKANANWPSSRRRHSRAISLTMLSARTSGGW